MLLAGPGMADQPLPQWPLVWHHSRDEKLLAIFCRHLELTETDYLALQSEMWRVSTTKRFDRSST